MHVRITTLYAVADGRLRARDIYFGRSTWCPQTARQSVCFRSTCTANALVYLKGKCWPQRVCDTAHHSYLRLRHWSCESNKLARLKYRLFGGLRWFRSPPLVAEK